MLARVFKIDVMKCECGGNFAALGAVQDLSEVRRYLKHIHIEYDPPQRGPPIQIQGSFGFEQEYDRTGAESVFGYE